jgi:hypothetical protein
MFPAKLIVRGNATTTATNIGRVKPGTDGTFSVRRRWQWKHRVGHQGLKPEVTSCFCGTTEEDAENSIR